MPEKLDEILKSLTGGLQKNSSVPLSKPKQFAFKTLDAFDSLAQQNAKTDFTKSIWNSMKWIVKNRIIPKKTDEQIRNDLKLIHSTLSPLFETIDTALEIQEARKLNLVDGEKSEAQKFIESNKNFKEALEVLEEL